MAPNINTCEDPGCCGPHWEAAAAAGKLDNAMAWQCPDCGTLWECQPDSLFREWRPVEFIRVISPYGEGCD